MIETITNALVVVAMLLWGYYLGKEGHEELQSADTFLEKGWIWAVLVVVTAAYAAGLVCAYDLISGRY